MRSRTSLLPWIVVLAAFGGGAYYWHTHESAAPANDVDSVMAVSVVTPQQENLSQKIHASGQVVAREDVVITAELTGVRITELFVDEGKYVKAGQKLAQLDAGSAKNQLAQLEAQYKQAEQNFRRVDKIKQTGAVSLSDVEEKRTAYEAAKAQYNDALLKVKMTALVSPVAGLVYERDASTGTLVGGNEPLFHIARDGATELEAQVAESDMAGLKPSTDTAILVQGRTTPIIGKIRLVSPRVDNVTRAGKLRISLPANAGLAIGSFAEAEIATHQTSGLVLPQTAVNLENGQPTIWIVGADSKVQSMPVTVTLRSGDSVMVKADNLAPDAQIVAKAGPFLREGDHVTVAAPLEATEGGK